MWLQALLNSLLIYAAVTLLVLPLATLVAVGIMRTAAPARRSLILIWAAGLTIPFYVQAGGWNSMFGQFGWWTLTQVGSAQNALGGFPAVIWIYSAALLPWVLFCMIFGLRRLDTNVEEAALLDVGWAKTICRITLPLLAPYYLFSIVVILILVSTDMTITNLYRVDTTTERLYQNASAGVMDSWSWVLPCLLGPLVSLFLLSAYGLLRSIWRWPDIRATLNSRTLNREYDIRNWRSYPWWLNPAVWAVTIVFAIAPIANLVWNAGWQTSIVETSLQNVARAGDVVDSGTKTIKPTKVAGHWSLWQLSRTLLNTPFEFSEEFGWTLYLGSVSATFWLLISCGLLLWSMAQARFGKLLTLTLGLLVFIPGPLVGLGTIAIWNRSEPAWCGWLFDHTLIGPITALGLRMVPLACVGLWTIQLRIPYQVWENARLEGVPRYRLILSWWNRNRRALVAIWLLLNLLSLSDLSSILLVIPPGVTPISARIFELLHYGVRYQESGVCLWLSLAAIGGVWAIAELFLPSSSRLSNRGRV